MADALTSPYGVGPSSLPPKTASPQEQFLNQLSQVRVPQGPNDPSRVPANEPAALTMPEDPDAGLSKVDPMDAAFASADEMDSAFAAAESQTAPEAPSVGKPSFDEMSAQFGPVEATKRSIGDSLTRAKLSFAVNDWEKAESLKKMYGAENVRTQDGKVQFRRAGDKGFRDLDPEQLEYIDDALDFARTAAEVSAEMPLRGAATVAGGIAGSAAGPAGTVAGAAAAGAASGAVGAMAAQTAGDFIAQGLLGIPKDPQRSAGKELAVAGGMGALFGSAGKAFSQWRLGKEAAKAANANATTALKTAQELEQISDNLAKNGITLKQGKITLSPGQQSSDFSPEGELLDMHLSTEGPVRNFFTEQGKLFMRGWDDLRTGISNATGKHVDDLFGKVKTASKVNTQLEGKYIEGFRDEALKNSKGGLHALEGTRQTLDNIMFAPGGLGFTKGPPKSAGIVGIVQQPPATNIVTHAPNMKRMQKNFPGATEGSLGEYTATLKQLERDLAKNKGSMSLAKVNNYYTRLRSFIDRNIDVESNRKLAHNAVALKDQLRDEWTVAIGKELEAVRPDAIPQYMESMAKYSDMRKAQNILGNILKKNDLSAAAFADQLFSPAQGKDRVRQVRLLLNENSPELWGKLRETYFERLTMDSSSLVKREGKELARVMDWKKMSNTIDQLDRAEILDQMFDGKSTFSKGDLKSFLTLAGRIDHSARMAPNALDSQANVGLWRRLVTVLMPTTSATAKIANVATLVGSMGKDKSVAKWLDGGGLELVLKGIPKPKQHAARVLLTSLAKQALRTEARMGVNTVLRDDSEVMP